MNQARHDILNAVNPTDSPGLLKIDLQRASTLREVGVKFGVTVKGGAFGVDANATLDQTYKQSTLATIRQVFYTVTFTPDGPQATGIWPGSGGLNGVSFTDLQPYMGPGNPPLYVDSVQYGRFICVTAQGAFSSSELTAALKVHWTASVSGNVNLDVRTKEILDHSQIKVYTLGVPGHQNFPDLPDPIKDLTKVYTSGLSLTLQNPGAPISFTCRHIADGTLARVGLAAEYTERLSAQGEDVHDRTFQVWDGPGGGHIDTSIMVNPGDIVKISAEGVIDSGVWLSEPHGPEGWPGHTADSGAPMNGNGTAYAHIIRFGNHGWQEAGRFWEGSPAPGEGGTLQLNINDNNPYNGNPRKGGRFCEWTVHVDVQRKGAEAAGVYI